MEIAYARGSTQDQPLALHAAGCAQVFVAQASGAQRDRPQLQAALDYARPGDPLVVWKLDRLARSLTQLIETIERRGQQVWIPVTVAALVPGVIFLAVPFIDALRLFANS